MAILFQDDCEISNPLDRWSSYCIGPQFLSPPPNETDNGGSVSLDTVIKNSGSKSIKCDWKPGDFAVGLTKNFNGGREIYMRWYARWENGWDWPSSHKYWILWDSIMTNLRLGFYTLNFYTTDKGVINQLLAFSSTQYGDVAFAVYEHANAEYPLNPGGPPHSGCANWQHWQPQVDVWYCFEAYIKIHATEGQIRFWVNGVEKEIWTADVLYGPWWYNGYTPIQPVNINTGNVDIERLDTSTQNNDQISDAAMWFDDVVIADTYIGPLGADVTPPYVDSQSPADEATDVSVNTLITCHIKDDGDGVDESSIVMTLNSVEIEPVITGGLSDKTLTFTPLSPLEYNTVYTITVDAEDLATVPNSMEQVSWSFTTEAAPDTTPPYVDGQSPADQATGVSVNAPIVCHVKDDGAGVDQSSIVMTVNGSPVEPAITGTPADTTVTYNPVSPLLTDTVYTITVDADDLA